MSRRMMYGAALVLLASIIGLTTYQATAFAKVEDKPLFARLVGPHTLLFAHVRIGEIMKVPVVQAVLEKMPEQKEQMNKGIRETFGVTFADIESITMYVDQPVIENGMPREPRPPYIMVRANKAIDADAVRAALGKETTKLQFGKYEMIANQRRGVSFLDDRTLLQFEFNNPNSKDMLLYFASLEAGAEVPASLQSSVALASSGKHQTVVGFAITKELGTVLGDLSKQMPPMMVPFKPLLKVQSGTVTMDYLTGVEKDYQMKVRAKFEDEGSAKAGLGAVRFGIAMAKMAMSSLPNRNGAEMKEIFDFATKQLDEVKVEAENTEVVIQYQIQTASMVPMLTAAIEKVRNAADRMVSASNMRQFMIAMHNYHNDYNKMPEAMTMKNGKPMHSWRVMILPYIEQDNLYRQIKMDEPWDSEDNKKLFDSIAMPKIFAHPGKKDGDTKMTYYKVFYTKTDVKPRAGFSLGKPFTLGQITVFDGTSNTIAMIEAGPPVLWYKPEDIEFDPKAQLPNMVSPWKDKRVSVAFFDASVRSAWLGTDEETWKGFITVDGGETVDFSKIEEKK